MKANITQVQSVVNSVAKGLVYGNGSVSKKYGHRVVYPVLHFDSNDLLGTVKAGLATAGYDNDAYITPGSVHDYLCIVL